MAGSRNRQDRDRTTSRTTSGKGVGLFHPIADVWGPFRPVTTIAEIESLIDAGELRGARLGSRYLVCPVALAQRFLKPMAEHAARASNVTRLGRSVT
jgi:hypothetical protein